MHEGKINTDIHPAIKQLVLNNTIVYLQCQ